MVTNSNERQTIRAFLRAHGELLVDLRPVGRVAPFASVGDDDTALDAIERGAPVLLPASCWVELGFGHGLEDYFEHPDGRCYATLRDVPAPEDITDATLPPGVLQVIGRASLPVWPTTGHRMRGKPLEARQGLYRTWTDQQFALCDAARITPNMEKTPSFFGVDQRGRLYPWLFDSGLLQVPRGPKIIDEIDARGLLAIITADTCWIATEFRNEGYDAPLDVYWADHARGPLPLWCGSYAYSGSARHVVPWLCPATPPKSGTFTRGSELLQAVKRGNAYEIIDEIATTAKKGNK